ncbi:hypothetical protein BCR44DRAFT_28397 [Catenaria anguillulae PL171]|uniref:ShKT domain-containing protein n=1 Tax=Catenaria anguillulae PL171 TaxID=765915 RepID=A0A1Y2HLS5_9FUNG|nr:hypothetical protein BCR44DRAFT_28397 [Catenaria anguillulae PL171]
MHSPAVALLVLVLALAIAVSALPADNRPKAEILEAVADASMSDPLASSPKLMSHLSSPDASLVIPNGLESPKGKYDAQNRWVPCRSRCYWLDERYICENPCWN